MENGIIKTLLCLVLCCSLTSVVAQSYQVKANSCVEDLQDFSQKDNKYKDHNGERCAVLCIETVLPEMLEFDLGQFAINHKETLDDEVWLWVSPDLTQITIKCANCRPLRNHPLGGEEGLKSGRIYRFKVVTGLPEETSTTQSMKIVCSNKGVQHFDIVVDNGSPERSQGSTFTKNNLRVGEHNIEITAKNYKPFQKTITLTRSKAYYEEIRLEPNFGFVRVNVVDTKGNSIEGCELYIDDERRNLKQKEMVEARMHRFEVKKNRYVMKSDNSFRVNVLEEKNLEVVMEPNFIRVNITAKHDNADIYVNGELIGRESCAYDFEFGQEYEIRCKRKGCQDEVLYNQEFTANSPKTITFDEMKQLYGKLTVTFEPANAELKIDGMKKNARNGRFTDEKIDIGVHRIQISCEDYKTIIDSVFIEKDDDPKREYSLIKMPSGVVRIKTDEGIAICVKGDNGEVEHKGTTVWEGKLPKGENTIVLKKGSTAECEYTIYVDEVKNASTKELPFMRELRVNMKDAKGAKVMLTSDLGERVIPANKKIKLEPVEYEITVTKDGYDSYMTDVDLSAENAQSIEVVPEMARVGSGSNTFYSSSTYSSGSSNSSSSSSSSSSSTTRDYFFGHSGECYIGLIGVGYAYDVAFQDHLFTASILPMRFKMFEMRLFEFETPFGAFFKQINYKPNLRIVAPLSRGFSMHVYGGVYMDLTNPLANMFGGSSLPFDNTREFFLSPMAGISLQMSMIAALPLEVFGEYQYPVIGKSKTHDQGFRIGVAISLGVPTGRD